MWFEPIFPGIQTGLCQRASVIDFESFPSNKMSTRNCGAKGSSHHARAKAKDKIMCIQHDLSYCLFFQLRIEVHFVLFYVIN